MYMSKRALRRIPLENLMDLKVDFSFKQLFGTEQNKDITIIFLNAILQKTGHKRIIEVHFDNIEIGGESIEDKQSKLDILVTTEEGKKINIEIQFNNRYDMVKRSIYYWSRLYGNELKKSESYSELHPVITINILNFTIFQKQTDLFHTSFRLYEDHEKFQLTDVLEVHFIEMPKLIRDWYDDKLDPWNDLLARWLLLLGTVDRRNKKVYEDIYHELEEIAMKDETLLHAFQSWHELSSTKEQIALYESRLKQLMDEEAALREAELRAEAAHKKGIEEGIEEGKLEMIMNGINNQVPLEVISMMSGYSVEELQRIIANLN